MSEIELRVTTKKKRHKPTKDASSADWYFSETTKTVDTDDGDTYLYSENGDNTSDGDRGIDSDADTDLEGLALLQTSLHAFNKRPDASVPISSDRGPLSKLWRKHWLGPENENSEAGGWTIGRATLLDAAGLKLLKFAMVTTACLVAVHVYANIAGDHRDTTYDLAKMVLYDGKPIASDCIVFFVVGKLYLPNAKGVDTLAFVVPLLTAALFQSWVSTHLSNLQHSITAYEMKCEWTWQMFLAVGGVCLPIMGSILVAHAREAKRRGIGLKAMVEFLATVVVFVLPYCVGSDTEHDFNHLHHWYLAWFLGMHCNLHGTWWSELVMSIMWGGYINGVAIFGRDPVQTCSLTLYQSQSQECAYLGEGMGYGEYTLDDLARHSGFFHDESLSSSSTTATDAIVCAASDATRWLSSFSS